jgi:hypothetical protein
MLAHLLALQRTLLVLRPARLNCLWKLPCQITDPTSTQAIPEEACQGALVAYFVLY